MKERDYFSPMFPDDIRELSFDFKEFLRRGEKIISTDWECTTESGPDDQPEFFLINGPVIEGSQSIQRVGNGVLNTKYRIKCTVMTDRGNEHHLYGFVNIRELCEE